MNHRLWIPLFGTFFFIFGFLFLVAQTVLIGRKVYLRLLEEYESITNGATNDESCLRFFSTAVTQRTLNGCFSIPQPSRRHVRAGSIAHRHINYDMLWNDLRLLIVIFLYAVACFIGLLSTLELLECFTANGISLVIFFIAKTVLYCSLLHRFGSVYAGTQFGFKQQTIWIMDSTIAIVMLVWCIWTSLSARIQRNDRVLNGLIQRCFVGYNDIVTGLVVLTDTLICVGCLYLFTKPLKQLIRQQSDLGFSNTFEEANVKLADTAKRFTVLTFVAVVSTGVSLVLIAQISPAFLPLDYSINASCLVLMSSYYIEWYPSLCACPIWCADHCCGCDHAGRVQMPQGRIIKTISLNDGNDLYAPDPELTTTDGGTLSPTATVISKQDFLE